MLRLALPTGDLRAPVAVALAAAGLRCDDYAAGSGALRLNLSDRDDVALRVFREKDIPIQVAMGQYDLGIASRMFKALADEGINIQMISTSEIKISVVIDEKYLELAVRVLHRAFELDKAPEEA